MILEDTINIEMGLTYFTAIPFGLYNASATLERVMDSSALSWKTILTYLEDVIAVGKLFEECLYNIERVFQRL